MNPSFEGFEDPPDGFHEKPRTRSNREGQFSPPEARMVVEPRMQLLGLCSFDARRKSRFLVFGAEKRRFFGAPKKMKKPPQNIFRGRKIFFGGRKSHLAAEHHNEAAPKKKNNKPRFFRLGAEKYCSLGARRKSRFLVLGAKKKKAVEKKIWGAEKNYWWPKKFLGGSKKLFRHRTP